MRYEIQGTHLVNSSFALKSDPVVLSNINFFSYNVYQCVSHQSGVVILSGPSSNVSSATRTAASLDTFSSLMKGILRIQFVAGLAGVEGRSGLSEFATG